MKWSVTEVHVLDDHRLMVTFQDGKTGIFDIGPHLQKPYYQALKNPDFFKTAKAEDGTVVWSDDVDIAPEFLYANVQ